MTSEGEPLPAVMDHIALAVGDWDAAQACWGEGAGGGLLSVHERPTYRSAQYRYAGGGKLELIGRKAEATGEDGFIGPFLRRFGERVHHLNLKVPDIAGAARRLEHAGLEVVDLNLGGQHWEELFLRPRQTGGVVVQLTWLPTTDEEFARLWGYEPREPAPGAPVFVGVELTDPDLVRAERLWRLLGATVTRDGDMIECSWPHAPLRLRIRRGEPAGPGDLLFRPAGGAEVALPATATGGAPLHLA